MSVDAVPDHSSGVVPHAEAPAAAPALTGRGAYALVGGLLVALVGLRLPATIAELERTMPDALRDSVGDPSLVRLSVLTGAFLALVVTTAAIAVFWTAARALERHLLDVSLGRGPLRVGLFTLTVSACFLGTQVAALASGHPADPPSAGWVLACLTGGLALVPFAGHLRRLPGTRAVSVAVSSVGLAFLTSLASLAA